MIILWLLLLPLLSAAVTTLAARRSEEARDRLYLVGLLALFALAVLAFVRFLTRGAVSLELRGLCGMGLTFRLDGFRGLYTLIASFMWLMTGLLSRQYFAHYRNRTRYYLFNQITLMATLGVFLSDDLYTTFLFFEIMSLSSYPWVVHDETPEAMAAGRTYLMIAVFGGMVTLMGLFLAWSRLGSLRFDALAAAQGRADLFLPGALILVGFAAKAGLFPLHVWLPQAHPVAPAPASALLSGVLTKTGVFGLLLIALRLMLHVVPFGNILLALGLITMLLGALLALFSSNLKRVLACSSMSQIGYITVGIAMAVLLGAHGSVPASGAIMHMVNHSLLKLALFMAAGVVYMNLHRLELNDIRGFGRGKPLLHAVFLLGALGLAGVPLFNGYLGKTLIHEGIVEYAEAVGGMNLYRVCEWIFLFAAGITTAYMLKLYIALFHSRHPTRQAEFDGLNGRYMDRRSAFALAASALPIPLLGMVPALLEGCARISEGFTGLPAAAGVHYFSLENLRGGAVSLAVGVLIYLLAVRRWLVTPERGYISLSLHLNWRESAPVRLFRRGVALLCCLFDRFVENPLVTRVIPAAVTTLFRALNGLLDGFVLLLHRTLFRRARSERLYRKNSAYYVFSYIAGHVLNAFTFLLNLTLYRQDPIEIDFTYVLAERIYDKDTEYGRATRTVSYGLLLFSAGLLLALWYLLLV